MENEWLVQIWRSASIQQAFKSKNSKLFYNLLHEVLVSCSFAVVPLVLKDCI